MESIGIISNNNNPAAFACSKLTKKTVEQGVKYVKS